MTESTFFLRDIPATERLARAFAACIEARDARQARAAHETSPINGFGANSMILALNGPLGVGKTKFVQALANAIGVEELVNSPTFTMLNEYHSGRVPLFHLDLYRLSEGEGAAAAQMLELELAEIMGARHLIVIEWAELLEKPELSEANFLRGLDHLVGNFSYDEVLNENPVKSPSSDFSSLYMTDKEDQARLVRIHPYGPNSESLLNDVLADVPELIQK